MAAGLNTPAPLSVQAVVNFPHPKLIRFNPSQRGCGFCVRVAAETSS
jgi:hypothetical protein